MTAAKSGEIRLQRHVDVTLAIRLGSYNTVTANVYHCSGGLIGNPITELAFATGDLSECRLDFDNGKPALWICRAAFDLTPEQADQVRAALPMLAVVNGGTSA